MLPTHTHTYVYIKTFVSFCVMLVLCYVFMKIYELVARALARSLLARSRHVVCAHCGLWPSRAEMLIGAMLISSI